MEAEKLKGLFPKLLSIQKAINGLGKDKKGNNYEYVSGNKVLGVIKPMMTELGLLLKQEVTSIENSRQDYQTRNGSKSEILSKVMMKFTWIDSETGERDENSFGANGQNDWEKGLGSALTYAERYFLLKYFHIPTDEDDIDNPDRPTTPPVPVVDPALGKPKLKQKPLFNRSDSDQVNRLIDKVNGTNLCGNNEKLEKWALGQFETTLSGFTKDDYTWLLSKATETIKTYNT